MEGRRPSGPCSSSRSQKTVRASCRRTHSVSREPGVTVPAAERPRTDNKNPHRLYVHEDRWKKLQQRDRHHGRNLEAVEKSDIPVSGASAQKASAGVRTAASRHQSWLERTEPRCQRRRKELTERHGCNVVDNGTSGVQRFWLWRFMFQ